MRKQRIAALLDGLAEEDQQALWLAAQVASRLLDRMRDIADAPSQDARSASRHAARHLLQMDDHPRRSAPNISCSSAVSPPGPSRSQYRAASRLARSCAPWLSSVVGSGDGDPALTFTHRTRPPPATRGIGAQAPHLRRIGKGEQLTTVPSSVASNHTGRGCGGSAPAATVKIPVERAAHQLPGPRVSTSPRPRSAAAVRSTHSLRNSAVGGPAREATPSVVVASGPPSISSEHLGHVLVVFPDALFDQ